MELVIKLLTVLQMINQAMTHLDQKFSNIFYKFSPWLASYRGGEKAIRDFNAVVNAIYEHVRLPYVLCMRTLFRGHVGAGSIENLVLTMCDLDSHRIPRLYSICPEFRLQESPGC
jgi:hypothetical protein